MFFHFWASLQFILLHYIIEIFIDCPYFPYFYKNFSLIQYLQQSQSWRFHDILFTNVISGSITVPDLNKAREIWISESKCICATYGNSMLTNIITNLLNWRRMGRNKLLIHIKFQSTSILDNDKESCRMNMWNKRNNLPPTIKIQG